MTTDDYDPDYGDGPQEPRREAEPEQDDSAHASGEYCIEWVGVDLAPYGPDKVWACVECGSTTRPDPPF